MNFKLKEFVFEDERGRKIKLSFDGPFSPEDVSKIVEKIQAESPSSNEKSQLESRNNSKLNQDNDSLTIREKLNLIVKDIKHGWFTSEHIRELYHYNFQEAIKPSTVSTYLARMFDETLLERRGSRARREYRVSEKQLTPIECVNQV